MPAAAVSAATSIAGSFIGAHSAAEAAKAQAAASGQNIGFENQVLGSATQNFSPYINNGQTSSQDILGLLGIGGNPAAATQAFNNFRNSTNYNFMLDQGLQGQSYLNAPNLYSGATSKALGNYAAGMAGNALGGYENMLYGQQGLGMNASNALANVGVNIAGQEAQARNLAAGAQGNADLAQGNAWTNALNGVGNMLGSSSFSNGLGGMFGGHGGGGGGTTGLDLNFGGGIAAAPQVATNPLAWG